MRCPKCNGYGIVGDAVPDILRGRGHIFSSNECDRCHGSGEVQMTNEEYLRSCNTEQLAEEIVNMTLLDRYKLYDQMESAEYEHGIGIGAKKVIVEWLKQLHQ